MWCVHLYKTLHFAVLHVVVLFLCFWTTDAKQRIMDENKSGEQLWVNGCQILLATDLLVTSSVTVK